jgi:hypothetical protein
MILPLPEPQPAPGGQFFGWLLMAVGGLMVLLCGACTVTLWAGTLIGATQTSGPAGSAAAVIVTGFIVVGLIGGVPTAGGALLVWAGWRLVHPRAPKKPVASTFD